MLANKKSFFRASLGYCIFAVERWNTMTCTAGIQLPRLCTYANLVFQRCTPLERNIKKNANLHQILSEIQIIAHSPALCNVIPYSQSSLTSTQQGLLALRFVYYLLGWPRSFFKISNVFSSLLLRLKPETLSMSEYSLNSNIKF